VITSRKAERGRHATYTLVDVNGLPKSSDLFQVGSTTYSTTKKTGF
jgi:hypothetical protein